MQDYACLYTSRFACMWVPKSLVIKKSFKQSLGPHLIHGSPRQTRDRWHFGRAAAIQTSIWRMSWDDGEIHWWVREAEMQRWSWSQSFTTLSPLAHQLTIATFFFGEAIQVSCQKSKRLRSQRISINFLGPSLWHWCLASNIPIWKTCWYQKGWFCCTMLHPCLWPPRFGKCLAKVRSKHLKKVRSQARQFLRRAAQEGGELDDRMGTNAHWLKHADLYPVLSYLNNNAVYNKLHACALWAHQINSMHSYHGEVGIAYAPSMWSSGSRGEKLMCAGVPQIQPRTIT